MTKVVRAVYGPVRGIMTLSDEEADKAIKDGWAVDASTTYAVADDFDVEKATKAAEAFDKKRREADAPKEEKPAAKKEAEKPVEPVKADEKPEGDTTAKSTESAAYQTRVSKPKE